MTSGVFETRWREIVGSVRHRRDAGEFQLGVFVACTDPRLLEFWAIAGFTFVIIDMEHATIDIGQADTLIATAIHMGLAPLVRAAPDDRQTLLRCVDAGAAGIVIPDVRSASAIEEWSRTISYPPSGTRGLAQVRANDWDSSRTTADPQWRPLLVPMIESMDAIENADVLAALGLADWFHIGLVDLGMGLRGQADAPSIPDLVDRVRAVAAKHGTALGLNQLKSPQDQTPQPGIQFVAIPDRALVLDGARRFVRGGQ